MENETKIETVEAKRSLAETVKHYAKIVWNVPAVKSVALTWLIRAGTSSSLAAIIVAIADAVAQ